MKPTIAFTARGKVVDQLDMTVAVAQSVDALDFIETERGGMRVRKPPKRMGGDFTAFWVIDVRSDRKLGLAHRHWRRQYYGLPQLPRHDRSGKQITLSEHASN